MFTITQALSELKRGLRLVYKPIRGKISLNGVDARDFLQRLSANDLSKLSAKNPLPTSFINNKGRMVDHCLVFLENGHEFMLVSSHKTADVLYDWLTQFHFVEDFTLSKINYPFGYVVEKTATPNSSFKASLSDGSTFFIVGDKNLDNSIEIPEEIWETLRIFSIMPACPQEINDKWMPHNINLGNFIAHNKGCYIGQEVIAKAHTYQKNVKLLGGAILSHADWRSLGCGTWLMSADDRLGQVTSVAPLYVENEINALVMTDQQQHSLSSPHHEAIKILKPFII